MDEETIALLEKYHEYLKEKVYYDGMNWTEAHEKFIKDFEKFKTDEDNG